MSNITVYLKCNRSIQVDAPDVYVKDLGEIRCADGTILAKCKSQKVYHFSRGDEGSCVISVLRVIEAMEMCCPGITVSVIGEPDVLVEWKSTKRKKNHGEICKVVLVCLVSFLGTAFTIMAYHNDIGIREVFDEIYLMILDKEPSGVTALEVSYSIGLFLGISVFFNHFGRKKVTEDPTPIEVAMKKYEKDVDAALIENAEREGKEEAVT